MRLRSIEIGGYKSFGNRTVLRFDAGLTAVVGPNGSGKSNIMDALRWVIGEGANRSLRVRRLDDVIFTGSAARAPAGLAEVRLRLDNEDGWLGLEAAEIEVQRRIHRDGESEFRLNGRSVRLREIQELFHNSGLGAGGYALMGQGLVDEVLRLRPIERRRLIEEVADVRRHRRKMIESRRQRERAEQHLERARILRDELEPRLRTLERQARRERRRLEVETELGAALRAWYGAAAAQLADQEQQRRAAAQAAETEQRRAESERSAAAEALAAAERAVEQARKAAEAAERDQRAAQARLNDLRHAAELDDRRREWLRGEAANLESELGLAAPDGEPQTDLQSDLERAGAAHAQAEARLREARERRDQAQRERDEAARRQAAAEALAERLAAERAELRSDAQALGADWVAQRKTLAELETAHADAKSAEAQAQAALTAAQAAETHAAEELERIEREQDKLDDQRRALERELDDLSARIAALDDFAPSDNGASPAGSAPKLLSRLRIRDGYEAAVKAALGAVADAELQPSSSAAIARAQAALEGGETGWLGVAVDLVRSRPAAARPGRPARSTHRNGSGASAAAVAVGLTAADVVEAPADLRPLADALLGGVRIAENAEQARALLADARSDAQSGAPYAAVTRDGLLIRADGVVAARGRDGAASDARARRQRQVAEWRERREDVRRELEQLPRPDEETRLQAAQARETAAASTRERAQAHARAAAALSAAEGARAAAQGERERLRSDALRIQSRQQRVRADAASVQPPALDDADAIAQPAGADLTDLAALEQQRDVAAAALADARARAKRIERRAQAVDRLGEVRNELQALSAAQPLRAAALADAESAGADSASLDSARAALRSAEQERSDARERLDAAQLTRVEAERAAVEAQAALRETDAAQQRLAADAAEDRIDLDALSPPDAQLPLDPSENPAAAVEQRRAAAVALRGRLQRLGPPQPEAAEEHESEQRRFASLAEQISDLEATEARLRDAERELEGLIDSRFRAAFDKVDAAFQRYFRLMFRGGQARLALSREDGPPDADPELDPDLEADADVPPAGVDITAQPPGKRVANLGQLSGGERALTAIALLFALLEIRPVPFCVLDEVDAALDEANVERFVQALKERAADIQFVVITHNRRTIEQADSIYGVTMASDGLSKVLSVRLDDLPAA